MADLIEFKVKKPEEYEINFKCGGCGNNEFWLLANGHVICVDCETEQDNITVIEVNE